MKLKQKSVADKVHELLAKQASESSDESSEETTAPKITEFDDEEYELPQGQSTHFRKQNVKLLADQSAKYKGKIATRKELELEAEEEEEENSDSASSYYEASDSEKSQTEEEDEEEDDDDDDDDDAHSDIEESEAEEAEESTKSTNIVSETNRQAELQKGVCVQNQLRIWERLLELRIQSQKILSKANQLPAPQDFKQVPDIEEAKTETVDNLNHLLLKMLELQQVLGSQNTEMRAEVKFSQKRAASNVDDEEPATKRLGVQLSENFKAFRNYRNNVLLKWDDRTRLMSTGANKRKSAQEDYDIIKKITHALSSRQVLIERSQTLKAKDKSEAEATRQLLPHIYDDSDFYHSQLRELIEYKSNTSSSMSEMTKQLIELQKMRQKMKKKVDTRASKGRKIRFVVHNKLINFKAPEDAGSWTNESKDELYKSLFA